MFDFDVLFQRHDPYGSFTAELGDSLDQVEGACGLNRLVGSGQAAAFAALVEYP